ncbi:hypothetical protein R2571_007052 [Pseudomonas aeruginosa]|nr:hypothetical protein [Pseudomonas aeruginosa]
MGQSLEFHPFAQLFPLITGEEYSALKQNIAERGQQVPILLFDGKILDGRNRYNCCQELGIQAEYEDYLGPDALEHVLSLNLYRRQLTVAQRALVAAEFSSLRRCTESSGTVKQLGVDEAARLMAVSPRSVSSATKVVKDGARELVEGIRQGAITVSAAELLCQLDHDMQRKLCEEGSKAIAEAARKIREESSGKTKVRQQTETRVQHVDPAPIVKVSAMPEPEIDDLSGEQSEANHLPIKPSATLRLFELAQEAMENGYEPETLAGQLLDEVEDGLDMQLLLFTVEAVSYLAPRLRIRSLRKND